jgi:hypothetical protein
MKKDKMIMGIKIEFRKDCNNYFENEVNNDIDCNLLIIALLETINDICKANKLGTEQQLQRYIELGTVDNYTSNEEKQLMERYKTF